MKKGATRFGRRPPAPRRLTYGARQEASPSTLGGPVRCGPLGPQPVNPSARDVEETRFVTGPRAPPRLDGLRAQCAVLRLLPHSPDVLVSNELRARGDRWARAGAERAGNSPHRIRSLHSAARLP